MDAWELTVVSCTVVTSPSAERRWPRSSRRFETFKSVKTSFDAVSTFRPGRRWPLVFIATYTVATSSSVNCKWHHHSSPNRGEANLPNRYSSLCWRPVTHAQTWASDSALYRFGRLSQGDAADHWCSPRRTVPTPTSWHTEPPPVCQVAKPVIRQLSPTLFRLLVDITKSTVVSRLNSCRFSSFRCKCYSFACIPALPW